jgi:hypothetical protein
LVPGLNNLEPINRCAWQARLAVQKEMKNHVMKRKKADANIMATTAIFRNLLAAGGQVKGAIINRESRADRKRYPAILNIDHEARRGTYKRPQPVTRPFICFGKEDTQLFHSSDMKKFHNRRIYFLSSKDRGKISQNKITFSGP